MELLTLEKLAYIANEQKIPIEDALLMAINYYGVHIDVDFGRIRTAFHLNSNNPLFSLAKKSNDLDFYLALPVNHKSPFSITDGKAFLDGLVIGNCIDATEDCCDSHYSRRLGTALNINPNSRSSCRGCDFCYTAYQAPLDKKVLRKKEDLIEFFDDWLLKENKTDLSHLLQISIVTGCYDSEIHLVDFVLLLADVLDTYNFSGKIFYLGSMLTSPSQMERLMSIPSFGYCMSVECFERRELLAPSKRKLTLSNIKDILSNAKDCGFDTNYTYIVGLESLEIMEFYMNEFIEFTTKFPIMNIMQLHQQHDANLIDPSFVGIRSLIDARKITEKIYKSTNMRPAVWENFRSLWYLKFADECLTGIRFPYKTH